MSLEEIMGPAPGLSGPVGDGMIPAAELAAEAFSQSEPLASVPSCLDMLLEASDAPREEQDGHLADQVLLRQELVRALMCQSPTSVRQPPATLESTAQTFVDGSAVTGHGIQGATSITRM